MNDDIETIEIESSEDEAPQDHPWLFSSPDSVDEPRSGSD